MELDTAMSPIPEKRLRDSLKAEHIKTVIYKQFHICSSLKGEFTADK